MPRNPLFSSYSQGENRVTSSMLAVFERIDLNLLEQILAGALGESSIQLVAFANQPPGSGHSVPDGLISGSFAYWIEVKTSRDAVKKTQLQQHVKNLQGRGGDERLLVITPDAQEPSGVTALSDPRVVWFNFRTLSEAIDSVLADELIAEQSRLLLRELQALLAEEGLVDTDEVVIVAARLAYPTYLAHGAYVCQPGRSFRAGTTHMGFYADQAIKTEVPLVLHREDQVLFTPEEVDNRKKSTDPLDAEIGSLIEALLSEESRTEGDTYQVFLLTPAEHEGTIQLEQPIQNDTMSQSGKPFAWTMGQRYISLDRLLSPGVQHTSDLDG